MRSGGASHPSDEDPSPGTPGRHLHSSFQFLLCACGRLFSATTCGGANCLRRVEPTVSASRPGAREALNKFCRRANLPSGAKQAAEKGGIRGENPEKHPSRAKAQVDSVGFMRGLKPPPPSESSFSASCIARIDFAGFMYGLKPVPFKTPT